MDQNRNNLLLKITHVTSTVFFAVSACYLVVVSLRRAGSSIMVITPLTAYSVPVIFLLVTWYLFVVYRGIARNQKIAIEHPLTTSDSYLFFYILTPLLGAIGGIVAGWGFTGSGYVLLLMAGGAVFTTFLVWIFVDPFVEMVEMFIPSSRRHRHRRIARARIEYRKQSAARQSLLKELEKIEQVHHRQWDQTLSPLAHKLAELICADARAIEASHVEVVDIGVRLWQYGGLECMKYIHSKAFDLCRQRNKKAGDFDCIACWWQGIGTWRNLSAEPLLST